MRPFHVSFHAREACPRPPLLVAAAVRLAARPLPDTQMQIIAASVARTREGVQRPRRGDLSFSRPGACAARRRRRIRRASSNRNPPQPCWPAATRIASELVLIEANSQQPSSSGTAATWRALSRPSQPRGPALWLESVDHPPCTAPLPAPDCCSLACLTQLPRAPPLLARSSCCLRRSSSSARAQRPRSTGQPASVTPCTHTPSYEMRASRLPTVALVCRIQLEPAQPRALAARTLRNAPRNLHATPTVRTAVADRREREPFGRLRLLREEQCWPPTPDAPELRGPIKAAFPTVPSAAP